MAVSKVGKTRASKPIKRNKQVRSDYQREQDELDNEARQREAAPPKAPSKWIKKLPKIRGVTKPKKSVPSKTEKLKRLKKLILIRRLRVLKIATISKQ